jgi:hypothetical protein
MNELKPCPFCGGTPILELFNDGFFDYARIRCCRVMFDWCGDETGEQAIAAWNRRVDARQLALKTRVCPMCEDCPDGCPVETPKDSRNIVTNADRIRSMSDEELHKFLLDFEAGDIDYAKTFCDLCCKDAALERKSTDCEGCLLWWLKNDATLPQGIDWFRQPVKED